MIQDYSADGYFFMKLCSLIRFNLKAFLISIFFLFSPLRHAFLLFAQLSYFFSSSFPFYRFHIKIWLMALKGKQILWRFVGFGE